MRINTTKLVDYIMVYLLIAFTGIDFFFRMGIPFIIGAMCIALLIFVYRAKKVDKAIAYYILFILCINFFQTLKFNNLPIGTYFGVIIRVLFAYFVIRMVEDKFIDYYIKILYFLTLVGLFFYFTCYIPGVENFYKNVLAKMMENPFVEKEEHYRAAPSIIFYTVHTKLENARFIIRNAGSFWEPGANAGFLTIALIFNIIKQKNILSNYNKVFLFALLTTFSTTGFVVFAFIIAVYIIVHPSLLMKLILMPVILFMTVIAFTKLDFVGEKIASDMNIEEAGYNTRFKSAWLDFTDALENPILGLGRSEETRFKGIKDPKLNHRNNGVTDFLASYGFIVWFLYFYLIYYSIRRICLYYNFNPSFALYSIIVIILMGFSEAYFSRVLFYGFTLLFMVYPKNEHPEEIPDFTLSSIVPLNKPAGFDKIITN